MALYMNQEPSAGETTDKPVKGYYKRNVNKIMSPKQYKGLNPSYHKRVTKKCLHH